MWLQECVTHIVTDLIVFADKIFLYNYSDLFPQGRFLGEVG